MKLVSSRSFVTSGSDNIKCMFWKARQYNESRFGHSRTLAPSTLGLSAFRTRRKKSSMKQTKPFRITAYVRKKRELV